MHPFEAEYERLRREVYDGTLPPFPGVDVVDREDILAETNALWPGGRPRLMPFTLSAHVTDPALLLEVARHETAHAAAILFDHDEGHGAAWQAHAVRCGAKPSAEAHGVVIGRHLAVVRCKACGWAKGYKSRVHEVLHVEDYRCPECLGRLEAESATG